MANSSPTDEPGSKIFYHPLVVKNDIPRLSSSTAQRVRRAIEAKLAFKPEIYGLPLRGTRKKYWKLRVGGWRIVYEIRQNKKVVILVIAHRKDIYRQAQQRVN